MRVHALRGAISVEANEPDAILDATGELMRTLLQRNELAPADVISCLFTATPDLDAAFPAAAARAMGFEHVPLMCAVEIDVPGALERIIRVLVHYQDEDGHRPAHVYVGRARALRGDLDAAQ